MHCGTQVIFIIDDQPLYLFGMQSLLNTEKTKVNVYSSSEKALEDMDILEPDLVLIGLDMPNINAISMLSTLKSKKYNSKLIIILNTNDCVKLQYLLPNKAFGIVLRSYQPIEVLDVLKYIQKGRQYIPKYVDSLLSNTHKRNDSYLSSRQKEILKLLTYGYSNKKIANMLGLSSETIKFHLNVIYKRLGVVNRTSAVAKALACDMF